MSDQNVIIIGQKYKLGKPIGSGSFGTIYHATHVETNENYAIKFEPINAKQPQLLYESRLLTTIICKKFVIGFPNVHNFGIHNQSVYMVMDRLGPSLATQKFTASSIGPIARQILRRIEHLHHKNFIHRDIKPENFLFNYATEDEKYHTVYLVDFGLTKRYYDSVEKKHIEMVPRPFIGTLRYASIHAHTHEQSRRDDLESIGYMLIYLIKKKLPWQGIDVNEKTFAILEKKQETTLEELCDELPVQFLYYMRYVRSLTFEEKPDYSYLRSLFKKK